MAAYGVSGLGVDYRGTDIDQPTFYDINPPDGTGDSPLALGTFTQLQSMRYAPAIAYQPVAWPVFSNMPISIWGKARIGHTGSVFRPAFHLRPPIGSRSV